MDDAPDVEVESAASRLDELRDIFLKGVARIIREENSRLLDEYLSMKPLLSVEDLAKTLDVSKRTVESILAEGKLKPIWVRGQRRFHPDAVDAYLRRQAKEK